MKSDKKMTKKQRRKLEKAQRLEEMERKKEEEEKARKEEEERKRIELLKKNELKEKYREEEKKRLQLEEKKYFSIYLEISKLKEKVLKDFAQQKEWELYLKCENKYNIEKSVDLNLMLTLLKENKVENRNDVEEILEKIEQSEKIIEELEERIIELKTQKTKNFFEYEEYINKIIEVNKNKINQICNYIMQKTEEIVKEIIEEDKTSNSKKKSNEKPEVLLVFQRDLIKLGFSVRFETSGRTPKTIDFKEMNLLSDIPKAFFSKKLVLIVKQFSHNYIDRKSFNIYLPKLRIIQTVTELSCYNYLPDSKETSKYIMKRVYNPDENLERIKDATSNFKIYLYLPDYVFLLSSDDLHFMYWDEDKDLWTKEGIDGVKKEFLKEKEKYYYIVSIPKMAPISIMSNYSSEFPYQSFKIRRIGYRTVLFNLETRRISLEFEIYPGSVELVRIKNKQLSRLAGQKYSPQRLLLELKKSNVFLFPDLNLVDKKHKNEDVEVYALRELTKACLYYHIQLSSWNSFVNEKSLIIRIRENPENDDKFHEDNDIDWNTVEFKAFKCKILKILENSEAFSKEKADNTVSHLNLYFLINTYKEIFVQNYYDENFIEDEILLIDTIYKFLQPMHLFSLCF